MSEVLSAIVTQEELEKIATHRREIIWHTSQLEILEQDVKALLDAGAEIEEGRFVARMTFRARHNPAWKQVVVRELGEDFAADIWRNSPLVTFPKLEVVEHPPLPLFGE